ncbi:MAG: SPASM domain-containing protein, partial [Desulfobacterales bacterium]|nr:SPASM domain-containing protein [Desulfobacterales bacterium]
VDFILVTHLTAYHREIEQEQAFMDNSAEGLALFEQYKKMAAAEGLDISQYQKAAWKFHKTREDERVCNLVRDMKDDALSQGIYLNLFHLLDEDPVYLERIKGIFEETRDISDTYGMALTLPGIRPKIQRYCPFIEEEAMFVTWDGRVSPCYFLWHGYQTMRIGYTKTVNPTIFGNLLERDPFSIWNSQDYMDFRSKVKKYDYPNCHSWCETRCDYVLDDPFYQDCFINDIPCCDCHWNLGFLNCLN